MKHDRAANIGKIVLALAQHTPGDWGDCSINNPITSILDRREPAHMLIKALAEMDPDTAQGIVEQLEGSADEKPF
jgi:hypothetical protein